MTMANAIEGDGTWIYNVVIRCHKSAIIWRPNYSWLVESYCHITYSWESPSIAFARVSYNLASKCHIQQWTGPDSDKSSKMPSIKVIKPRPEWQWKVLKVSVLALCVMMFIWQFSYIFRDYLDGRTTITTEQGLCWHIAHLPPRGESICI